MAPSSEQYAQLAALFTTEPDPEVKSSIELLLPAHLPVQGGLWLVPYAGREAADGLSILLKMHEDTIDLAAIGQGNFDLSGCASLDSVMECIGTEVAHWIVQPPSDADPTSLLHCDADCVTLLSGADQAAVVGAYRLLKGLISASGTTVDLPSIRLVIVGAEERAASDAASRIIQTAHHQLDVQIEVGLPLPAMGSTSRVISQVSIPRTRNIVDLMSCLRNSFAPPEEIPTTHRFEHPDSGHSTPERSTPDHVEHPEPSTPQEPIKMVEPQVPHVEEQPVVETVSVSMNSYVSYVEGLLSIAPRCPEHEHIELAIDGKGRMHVLANAEDFRDCAIVAGWFGRHHKLIELACGGMAIDTEKPPIQHLFTDDAVSVADLHGSGVRLHLIAEVEVEGKTGTFSTPLN